MEIERKFLVPALPENLSSYPCHLIEQAYLCTSPVVRIRRQDDDFILTYKGSVRNTTFRSPEKATGTCSRKQMASSSQKNAT